MNIVINGNPETVQDGCTVAGLLAARRQITGVAVAVNKVMVPRGEHTQRSLLEGDEIEIVSPMQGG